MSKQKSYSCNNPKGYANGGVVGKGEQEFDRRVAELEGMRQENERHLDRERTMGQPPRKYGTYDMPPRKETPIFERMPELKRDAPDSNEHPVDTYPIKRG